MIIENPSPIRIWAEQLAAELPHCRAPGPESAGFVCGRPARWRAAWPDRELAVRELAVCDEHKSYAQACHDGDHQGDQTGIWWEELHSFAALAAYEIYTRRGR